MLEFSVNAAKIMIHCSVINIQSTLFYCYCFIFFSQYRRNASIYICIVKN